MVCIFFGRCDCHSGITFYLVVVMVKIYHRDSKKLIEEKEYQEELLIFLYKTVIGRSLLKLFVARPWFSNLRARYQKSPESKKDILPFVKEYHVDTFVMGDDWEGKFDFLKEEGCEVVYLPRTPEISSSQIKEDLHTIEKQK